MRIQEAHEDVDDLGIELRPRAFEQRLRASSSGSRRRYGRSVVIAWNASQTKTIRDSSGISSPAIASG